MSFWEVIDTMDYVSISLCVRELKFRDCLNFISRKQQVKFMSTNDAKIQRFCGLAKKRQGRFTSVLFALKHLPKNLIYEKTLMFSFFLSIRVMRRIIYKSNRLQRYEHFLNRKNLFAKTLQVHSSPFTLASSCGSRCIPLHRRWTPNRQGSVQNTTIRNRQSRCLLKGRS